MNYRLELELKVAWQRLKDLETEMEEAEKRGNKHMAAIKFGQIIEKKQHIESLERIAEHEEFMKNPVIEKEKQAV